jgi:hypothetical protein
MGNSRPTLIHLQPRYEAAQTHSLRNPAIATGIETRLVGNGRYPPYHGPCRTKNGLIGRTETKMRRLIVSVLMCCLSASVARAEYTGNDLYDACRAPRQTPANGLCLGYVFGSMDMLRSTNHMLSSLHPPLPIFCEPAGVTGEQLLAMATNYLAAHPEKRHFVAGSILLDVYTSAFPCRAGSSN